MKPSSTLRWLLLGTTHLLAIAAGVVLFHSIPAFSPKPPAPAPVVSEQPKSPAEQPPSEERPETPPTASLCEAAWQTLVRQGLPQMERQRAGVLILHDWIKVDWRGALDAVMKEDSSDDIYLGEFLDQFVRDPMAIWKLIEKKTYGARTDSLEIYLKEAIIRVNPDNPARQELFSSLPEPVLRTLLYSR